MVKLTLEVDDKDVGAISDFAKATSLAKELDAIKKSVGTIDRTTRTILEGADNLILMDRIRAIDQIKRLYAVIVGFASITLLSNVVLCIRYIAPAERGIDAYAILFAQVVSFFSLLILFLLGAERLLDARYLQVKSFVPAWGELIGDVLGLLVTASFFAILANLLPAASANSNIFLNDLRTSQGIFCWVLCAVYVTDLLFIWLQQRKFSAQSKKLHDRGELQASAKQAESAESHSVWMAANGISAIFVFGLALHAQLSPPQGACHLGISAALVVIHIGRFWYDVSHTFEFYYPKEKLSCDPTLEPTLPERSS